MIQTQTTTVRGPATPIYFLQAKTLSLAPPPFYDTTLFRYAAMPLACSLVPALSLFSQVLANSVLYGISLYILLKTYHAKQHFLSTGVCIAIAHGLVHNMWPFIGRAGLAPEHPAGFDMLVHTVMAVWAQYGATQHTLKHTSRAAKVAQDIFGATILVGTLASVALSLVLAVDHPIFVHVSKFPAVGSGYFALMALVHGVELKGWHTGIQTALWGVISMGFFYLFRSDNAILAKSFDLHFFEGYFMFPLWVSFVAHRMRQSSIDSKQA